MGASTTDGVRIDRAAALAPYLSLVGLLMKQKREHDSRLRISIRKHTIEVQSWERAQLRDQLDDGIPSVGTFGFLLCEGLAAQARALSDLNRWETATSTEGADNAPIRKDMVIAGALVIAVHSDIEAVTRELIAKGRSGQAHYLADFGKRMLDGMAPFTTALGEDGVSEAQTLAPTIASMRPENLEPPPAPAPRTREIEVEEVVGLSPARDSATAQKTRTGRGPDGKFHISTLHTVVVAAVVAALVIGGYFAVGAILTEKLTVARCLKYVHGINTFQGDPPLLKVTVDPDYWKDLDPSGRTAMVHDVAAGLSRLGYTQAVLLSPDGKEVGRWDQIQGSHHE
jgi:hypothetical protein